MARSGVARRYAKALFELAKAEDAVPTVREQLGAFSRTLQESDELRKVLFQPLHPVAQRRAVLEAVTRRLGATPLLASFYGFLVDQRRLVDFQAIQAEFERLADESEGLQRARVRSAAPLSDAQRERLRRALSGRVGAELELQVEEDPTLLGGVVAQVGDLVFDGSLRSQLERLRVNLAEG